MSIPKFAETYNLVAFLEKPKESNGFEGIIDFLNASSIKYALTVNPTVYESCIKQFWATAKAKTVNGERQIQALVDKKKVIITKKSVRSDLMLEDVEGTECLPNDLQKTLVAPTDSHSTPIITQPSSSKHQKKRSKRKQMKDNGPTEPIPDKATNEEPISTHSADLPQSGEDRLQLTELMSLCTKLQKQVLDLEEAKTAQEKDIASLKKRVKQLEKRRKSRISGLKRLRKVGSASRVELNDEDLMFDNDVLNGDEVFEEPIVNDATTTSSIPVSAADPVTTASATTTVDELTLAQTLIEIKAAKPKAVTTAATTITTAVASTRPKAKGIVFHDQEEQAPAFTPIVSSSQASQLPQAKDKGKAKMVEPEKPLKKKDQIALDEELALRIAAIIEELDSIQAMIEADEQLAARLQAEEQE
ncbi:hypothetical protein Tco_0631529 [Tanacetum coccineum]